MTTKDEALKLALEALEWINRVNAMDFEYQRKARESLNAIYEALAEQPAQQEPVAWMYEDMMGLVGVRVQKEKPIVARPVTPLYTSPPAQRTWVGLTDEEMDDCWNKLFGTGNYNRRNVYRAIEAELKEKNA